MLVTDTQQDKPRITYRGPFQIRREGYKPFPGAVEITATRIIHGERVSAGHVVTEPFLSAAVDPKDLEEDAVDLCIGRVKHGVFQKSGTTHPYIELRETDTREVLEWLGDLNLPVHAMPCADMATWDLVDRYRRPVMVVHCDQKTADALAKVINSLPVLLLARE